MHDAAISSPHLIAVCWLPGVSATVVEAASALAAVLNLPLVSIDSTEYRLLLVHTGERLELRQTGPRAPGPVYADFTSPALLHRLRPGASRQELLIRAVGHRAGYKPSVIDATAGLGRDAFVLAALGCRVTMFERSPVVVALLADGLARAAADPRTATIVSSRLKLICADSRNALMELKIAQKPDVVFLDPMFPQRTKNALAKKELQLLQAIIGPDQDSASLLAAALNAATRRVVVKRPRLAPPLDGPKPAFTLAGSSSRFDIYLQPAIAAFTAAPIATSLSSGSLTGT